MSDGHALEQRYRRLLALYPQTFRREYEEEMLAVLLEGAREGQRRPGVAESLDLLRCASWMRVRSGAPRSAHTVVAAVRLMYLGALLELVTLATALASLGNLRSAILDRHPDFTSAQWHALVAARIVPLEIGAPIAAVVWLWLAWANGRGHGWARLLLVALAALNVASLLVGLAQHSATFAPEDVIAGAALCLVGLVTVGLVFHSESSPHYRRSPAGR
jgi:hypothetical protein